MKATYANVTSTVALVLALGGTSWAATQLPRNSVGPKQLRADSVSGDKVKNGSLSLADLVAGANARGPRGPAGPGGSTGGTGPTGPVGPRGSSDAYIVNAASKALSSQANIRTTVATLKDVPPGNYILMSTAYLVSFDQAGFIGSCEIRVNGDYAGGSSAVIGNGAGSARAGAVTAFASLVKTTPFQVTMECASDQSLSPAPSANNPRLVALRVESLHSS